MTNAILGQMRLRIKLKINPIARIPIDVKVNADFQKPWVSSKASFLIKHAVRNMAIIEMM